MMFWLPLLYVISNLSLSLAQTCSPSSPCEIGCCNKWGSCGFGPDYCGDTCISDCGRKSECNPGFGSEWSDRDKCPLNVCCSKHGFCGTTEEFCGDSKVNRKSCSKTNGNARIVGYFEGWAQNRPCNVFWPEQIPIGLYTHINFAFGTIDPATFKVGPAASTDIGIYKRLMLIKKKDPDLKVFIAIGGWTFNDPGPTATTFSDIAASVPRQKTFIDSLLSFMSTHGFDGIDLDWEYPVAEDRSGRKVDFENFTKFMERLKSSLKAANKGVSITIPASYWYLQHFDVKGLAKAVDWFNVMSYDMHGTWDKGNKWTGNFLNAHTNLTEISLALDLLWRNDINPSQVVLGLGFYGRAFTASSSSCLEPKCTFESGGEKGRCSREVGILLNSEIDELVKKNGVTPKHYKTEAVKIASWGNQWVGFDDEETLRQKSEFAQSLCMGGLMVWAISHDTEDAKYNRALAKVANRKITSLPLKDGPDEAFDHIDVKNEQCKWTNCGESCPTGWIHMRREDKGAGKNEYMLDESGCWGTGTHAFCCPSDHDKPTCGWYSHNNGACKPDCPAGTVEVGSNDKYCKKSYQAACCTTSSKSMKLYSTCEWGMFPHCDEQKECSGTKNKLLASSSNGSGGSTCNMHKDNPLNPSQRQERKFCCDTSNEKSSFGDCEWFDGLGFGPSGKSDSFCLSGCPNERIRVSMEHNSEDCYKAGGSKSKCCLPRYFDTIEVENPKLDGYRDDLRRYMEDPKCANPGSEVGLSFILSLTHENKTTTQRSLARRVTNPGAKGAESLLLALITKAGTESMLGEMQRIWNDNMGTKYPKLKLPGLRDFVKGLKSYATEGPIQVVHDIICSPSHWNALAGKTGPTCEESRCTTESCEDNSKRSVAARSHKHAHALVKRVGSSRDYHPVLTYGGQSVQITITLPSYYQTPDYAPNAPILDEAVDFVNRGDCPNTRVTHFVIGTGELFDMEHPLDGNVMMQFMEDAAAGRLRSGTVLQNRRVAISFFQQVQTLPMIPNAPPLPGGAQHNRLFDRVMDCLGSTSNTANFVLAHKEINVVKSFLMRGARPVSIGRMQEMASNMARPEIPLREIRDAIGFIRYMNHQATPNVNQRLTNIVNCVDEQLGHGESVWNAAMPNDQVALRSFWRIWIRDFFRWVMGNTTTFSESIIREMRLHWGVSTGEFAVQVLEILDNLESQLSGLSIDTRGFN